jgi:hypothetical protein
MKKFIFTGIGIVLLIIIGALFAHFKAAQEMDAKNFQKLVGGWVAKDKDGLHNVTTIHSDSGFTCSVTPEDNMGLLYYFKGTLQIKNGILIETITNHSDTNVHLPFISRMNLVSLKNNNFVVKVDGTTNELVFWKMISAR